MVSESMEREMVDKNDVEAIAKEVFREFGLNWEVFHVDDKPKEPDKWWIQARMPDDLDEVLVNLYPNKGTREVVKKSLAEAVKRKLQEL